ncbi:MAG: Wzz/FepE/Etk N-terminal domain-containing protein [Pirellulales bacterium]
MSYPFNTPVNQPADVALHPFDVIRTLHTHVRWWAIPAVVCAILAAAYSLIAPRTWRATQALIVRPEAASVSEERLGKFADLSEMKTLQETILELAKSQSVVQATLREVGPPRRYRRPEKWPTPLDVEDFRDCIDMRPPGGAEFGKTEVFYLAVRDTDRQRASALVGALCGQLELRMQQLRDQRAQSMIAELERTVAMADGDLAAQTARLSSFEAKIGPDLAELRNLNAEIGSQGGISQELQTIETERRANESRHHENVRLLELLSSAQDDPQQLLATPNTLLVSQPAVKQLKSALVNAQLHTANLLGSLAEKHPFVVAAREAEDLIRRQLNDEVAVAIRGLEVDIELGAEREQSLAAKWTAARERLARLAEARAEYSTLAASVTNHTRLVEAARKNLADARAHQAGARSASVISRIDGVEAGVRPVGPGRKVITAAGGFGGLLLGLGFVFLFATTVPSDRASTIATSVPVAAAHPVHKSDTANCKSNGKAPCGAENNVGIFRGMTLEQAIRSVEQRG